jgi:replicative DNA helicase
MTTSRSEDTLYSSLTDVDALEQVFKIGLNLQAVPTPPMRDVVRWALDYFDRNGQRKAPSREALQETWGQVMEDSEVTLVEADVELDEVQWAIQALHAQYVLYRFQEWQKESASALHESSTIDRLDVLTQEAHKLNELVLSLRDKTQEVEGLDGFLRSYSAYEQRAATAQQHRGMAFGIPEVDAYTYGIHEGELAVLAAGPKTGKSVSMAFILLNEWAQGRRATYYTLENSVEMSYDRLVCIRLGVDHDRYRRGECLPDEVHRVQQFLLDEERMTELKDYIRVVQPGKGNRTVQWITRHARSIGTQSLLIDQLTFMEASHRSLRGPDKITDIMHDLKDAIGGRTPMSCLLAHQINREGMREAKKNGLLEMWMLAEGSEVERTCDWAFGLYASDDERRAQMIKWQTLATRRGSSLYNARLAWRPWINQVTVLDEIGAVS